MLGNTYFDGLGQCFESGVQLPELSRDGGRRGPSHASEGTLE